MAARFDDEGERGIDFGARPIARVGDFGKRRGDVDRGNAICRGFDGSLRSKDLSGKPIEDLAFAGKR